MRKLKMDEAVIDVTEQEALGIFAYLRGLKARDICSPLGFAMAPEDANDDWRRGYVIAAFGISDRSELQI